LVGEIAATVQGAAGAVNRKQRHNSDAGDKNTLSELGIDNARSKLDSIKNWNSVPIIGT
jgi:hypothetical protein